MSGDVKNAEKPKVVLVLQGGGALGAYHIGAYEALVEHGFDPDWFCGISIGAFNAAILAGNKPEERLERLEDFWQAISWPTFVPPMGPDPVRSLFNTLSNSQALTFGQPNFFSLRPVSPYFEPPAKADTISFYDTSPLRTTLPNFVNFDLINSGAVRISLGATDLETGGVEFFDNVRKKDDSPPDRIAPEHVMASGSLPPGFPATRCGDKCYWDGGCVSNTPLEALLDDMPSGHTIAFMIDLWSAEGPPPRTINDVLWRGKQIQYASRTAHHIDAVATKVNLRRAMTLLEKVEPQEVDGAVPADVALTADQRLDIVHIIYHPGPDQIPNSDAEFSRTSIAERRAAGYKDMKAAIEQAPWFRVQKPPHLGAMVHRVVNQHVATQAQPNLSSTSDRVAAE